MGVFITPLQIEKVDGKPNNYKLLYPLIYTIQNEGHYIVPTGFETDGASIPKILWSLIGSPWTGEYTEAAVLHDYLYATGKTTRSKADSIFLMAMEDLKVRSTLRYPIYLGVRTGGWVAWNNYRRRDG